MVCAVIVCAGSSSRMGQNKMGMLLGDKTVWETTISVFDSCPCIDEIVAVCSESIIRSVEKSKSKYKKLRCAVLGSDTRQKSVAAGISAISKGCTYVAIHDGARPIVSHDVILRTLGEAEKYGACVPCVPVKDTVKIATDDGFVKNTPDRNTLLSCQTPQIFSFDVYIQSAKKTLGCGEEFTDDSGMVEYAGFPVRVCMGDYENIKITTPEDMLTAERIMDGRTSL